MEDVFLKQIESLNQKIADLTSQNEEQQKHLKTYHQEVETLMRQLQRNAQNVIILSERLRAHGLDYKIVPDEKEVFRMKKITDEQIATIRRLAYDAIYKIGAYPTAVYDLEDLVQDTTLAVIRRFKDFDEEKASFVTFIYSRVHGAILDALRHYDNRTRTMQEQSIPVYHVPLYDDNLELTHDLPIEVDFDTKLELDLCEKKLKGRKLQIFKMARKRWSEEQIMEATGLSRSAVSSYKSESVIMLRKAA